MLTNLPTNEQIYQQLEDIENYSKEKAMILF